MYNSSRGKCIGATGVSYASAGISVIGTVLGPWPEGVERSLELRLRWRTREGRTFAGGRAERHDREGPRGSCGEGESAEASGGGVVQAPPKTVDLDP
ncbi:hypothetical protein ON010_g15350 [Phytophthora cinnamomi]|nr:hypothetical protein ON010_g15350 [Phytophthora cinnamomi]